MATILISGYYGYSNLGDEAVLGGILAGLRAHVPGAHPVVLSGDPAATRELHGVEAIPRMSMGAIRQALAVADLFISGGGSLLQDVTSFRSPLYYLGLIRMAQKAGVPTMMLAQGVGPLNNPLNRWLARRCLNHLRAITVRDAGSKTFLEELGVKLPIEVTADPSLLLEPMPSARLDEWWQENIPENCPVIGVALRPWKASTTAQSTVIAEALTEIAGHAGALPIFIPMQRETDLSTAREMSDLMEAESRVLDVPLNHREMLEVARRCDLMIAMRLHALIFAVQQAAPAYGLSYDPKVTDFCREAGLPKPPPVGAISKKILVAELKKFWNKRAHISEELEASAREFKARAERNFVRVGELVGK